MRIDRYVLVAGAMAIIAVWFYLSQFSSYELSDDPEDWAQLGDYIGGILNPILSFISVLLIVRSLGLQRSANEGLQQQMHAAQRGEITRAFEAKFFGMLKVQSENFSSLALVDERGNIVKSVDAVLWIETKVDELRTKGADDKKIANFINAIDSKDQLYGLIRGFYVTVKFVVDGLAEDRGFTRKERESEIHTLINFSDFALVRLYKLMMQFAETPAAQYLRSCSELGGVMADVGLNEATY
ncbi:hypothetical protein [Stenotrophomonas rhizophila]|uniref:hypothetical protein n=1 Tax=Stenotrophomonas rhizophila TaxID=216778 RepID=UPI00081C4FF2|nr:hypothetical protein [Stenotrophomonas rhizophila]AOA71015.1 hypothetical protein BAY15_0581 [Stenotrophomonas rhizophila]